MFFRNKYSSSNNNIILKKEGSTKICIIFLCLRIIMLYKHNNNKIKTIIQIQMRIIILIMEYNKETNQKIACQLKKRKNYK